MNAFRTSRADPEEPARAMARWDAAGVWLGLFLLALGARAAVAWWRPPVVDGDQRLYRILAESMAAGTGYVNAGSPQVTVHPLLPTLHALAIRLGVEPGLAGTAITLLVGALLAVVAGRTISRMLGVEFGLAAGLAVAFQPHHVLRSSFLEPDLLTALLCFWTASLLFRGDHGLAGAVLGLCYLNRPEMLLLAPVVLWIAWRRGASASGALRLVASLLLVSSVFLLYIHAETGRWALSGKDHWQYMLGVHQWRSGNQPLSPAQIPELTREIGSPLHHVLTNPREFARGYAYRFTLLLRNLGRQLGYVLFPLLLVGLIHTYRSSRDALALLALPLYLIPVLATVGTFFRHSLVAGPVLVALCGVGAVAVWRRLRSPAPTTPLPA